MYSLWLLEVIYLVGPATTIWVCVSHPWLTFWKSFCCLALSVMCLQAATHCWTSAEALAKLSPISFSVPSSNPFSGGQRSKCSKYLTPAGTLQGHDKVSVNVGMDLFILCLKRSWGMRLAMLYTTVRACSAQVCGSFVQKCNQIWMIHSDYHSNTHRYTHTLTHTHSQNSEKAF